MTTTDPSEELNILWGYATMSALLSLAPALTSGVALVFLFRRSAVAYALMVAGACLLTVVAALNLSSGGLQVLLAAAAGVAAMVLFLLPGVPKWFTRH